MKKGVKIMLMILVGIVVLWSANFVVDFIRYKNGQEPLLSTGHCLYDYEDGYAHEHKSFGYKVIKCERRGIPKTALAPFWVKADDMYMRIEIKESGEEQGVNSVTCHANGFEMKIFSDKQVYKTTEAIQIWATLEYFGKSDTVTIWHGLPYITFSITDGKDFNMDPVINSILTHTVLKKGELYHFDFQKSGSFSQDDPDADFWRSFYAEKKLILPAGKYTVSVEGAFSLSVKEPNGSSGLLCELPIKVEE